MLHWIITSTSHGSRVGGSYHHRYCEDYPPLLNATTMERVTEWGSDGVAVDLVGRGLSPMKALRESR